jgi:hypothetical protein
MYRPAKPAPTMSMSNAWAAAACFMRESGSRATMPAA